MVRLFGAGLALLLAAGWLGPQAAPAREDRHRPELRSMGRVLLVQDGSPGDRAACDGQFNAHVFRAKNWSFFLRGLDTRNGKIVIKLAVKNNTVGSGLIALAPGVLEHTALIDDASAVSYPVEQIEGIEVMLMKVQRRKYANTFFTFPYPGEARTVRFKSTWLTARMRGAGEKIKVEFTLQVPARDACKV